MCKQYNDRFDEELESSIPRPNRPQSPPVQHLQVPRLQVIDWDQRPTERRIIRDEERHRRRLERARRPRNRIPLIEFRIGMLEEVLATLETTPVSSGPHSDNSPILQRNTEMVREAKIRRIRTHILKLRQDLIELSS